MTPWPPEIVPYVRAMLPSMEELAAIHDPADMGPEATIPAIYIHLLLLRIERLENEALLASVLNAKSDRPWAVPDDEWPSDALMRLNDVTTGGEAAGMSHVALPVIVAQHIMRYVGRLEDELANVPAALTEMARAAVVRSTATAIVTNVEGFTGELDANTRVVYVNQAVREINTVIRRLAPAAALPA